MDSEFLPDGRLLDIVDDAWRKEKLPHDDIAVPQVRPPKKCPVSGLSACQISLVRLCRVFG